MIDVTGSLQIKNKIYQAVLMYKQDNKQKTKWVSTKVPAVKGNKKLAQAKLEEIRKQLKKYGLQDVILIMKRSYLQTI